MTKSIYEWDYRILQLTNSILTKTQHPRHSIRRTVPDRFCSNTILTSQDDTNSTKSTSILCYREKLRNCILDLDAFKKEVEDHREDLRRWECLTACYLASPMAR
jgi:hypothetical protein